MSERKELVDFLVSINRVTKVTKGGKSMSFAALVVAGDQQGRVGVGLGKGREVTLAIAKATNQARKRLIVVALRGTTLPYNITGKHGASKVVLRPAYKGTGVIAGGAVRKVLVALGCKDVLAKSLGSRNPQNLVKATLNALAKMRSAAHLAKMRGKTTQEMVKGA